MSVDGAEANRPVIETGIQRVGLGCASKIPTEYVYLVLIFSGFVNLG